jgi:hypothetical protein
MRVTYLEHSLKTEQFFRETANYSIYGYKILKGTQKIVSEKELNAYPGGRAM